MTRPQHVCPNKGCRGCALGRDDDEGDEEQEGSAKGSAPCSAHLLVKTDRKKEMT